MHVPSLDELEERVMRQKRQLDQRSPREKLRSLEGRQSEVMRLRGIIMRKVEMLEQIFSKERIDDGDLEGMSENEQRQEVWKEIIEWQQFNERLLNQAAALLPQIIDAENDVITSQLED